MITITSEMLNSFAENISLSIKEKLNLSTYNSEAEFLVGVDRPAETNDIYYNSTQKRILVFISGQWKVVGGVGS